MDSVWQPTGRARERNKKNNNDAASESANATDAAARPNARRPDKIVEELSIWEAYADRFITLYQLDEAQRATALSCLYELTARAHSHRKRYRKKIAELEYRINSGFEPNEQEEMIASLKNLYGPIDKMFTELKDRLNGIPTTAQKDGAAIMLPFEPLLNGKNERPALTQPPGSPASAGVDDPE